ncbi:MAG: RNA polymerase sigma factor [Planctomycetota bacterium]
MTRLLSITQATSRGERDADPAVSKRPAVSTHAPRPTRPNYPTRPERPCQSRRDRFAVLYRAHYPQIAGYLYRRVGDRDVAEDLAADTFTDAYRTFWRYRATGAPISAWFFRIATNKANAWARRVRRGRLTPPEPTPDPRETAAQREQTLAMYQALRRLPPEHQAVIALVRFESLSHEEAARALSVRVGTVKSRLHRAIESLRQELAFMGDDHA